MCHCWPCLLSNETWQRRRLQFFVSMCMCASVCVFSCKLSMHFLRWTPEACVRDWKRACYLGLALQSFVFNSFKHCTLWSEVNIYSVKRTSLDAGKVLRPVTKKKNALETTFAFISSENQKVVAHETVIMVGSWVGQRNCISHFGRHTKRRRPVQKLHSSFCLELMPACTMLICIFFNCLCHLVTCIKYVKKPQNYVSLSAVLLEKKNVRSQTPLTPMYYQHKFKCKQVTKQCFFQACDRVILMDGKKTKA